MKNLASNPNQEGFCPACPCLNLSWTTLFENEATAGPQHYTPRPVRSCVVSLHCSNTGSICWMLVGRPTGAVTGQFYNPFQNKT
uniref:(California timema) hypothetical protein n=1 Tax=Timema californicum TaxID=61474 RepID=A0A7R9J491_TIMCA|nr:unnamed protein product [Timema californicum]